MGIEVLVTRRADVERVWQDAYVPLKGRQIDEESHRSQYIDDITKTYLEAGMSKALLAAVQVILRKATDIAFSEFDDIALKHFEDAHATVIGELSQAIEDDVAREGTHAAQIQAATDAHEAAVADHDVRLDESNAAQGAKEQTSI